MPANQQPAPLAVLLAPHGEADEILAVLADYSAAGLVVPFLWVAAEDVDARSVPAIFVADGRSSQVVLQTTLTAHRFSRLRAAVLVPADAPAERRATRTAEQRFEQLVRTSSIGTPITLLRLLFTHGGTASGGYDSALVLEGWHNLLTAPEDSAGPNLGTVALDRLDDPVQVACHVTPVLASVAGLWSGIDRVVLDDLAILPGTTLRAVRSFYRQLDATVVEDRLRMELFDPDGRLPLPRSGHAAVLYVRDVELATRSVARALWTKHRNVLRGSRREITASAAQAVSPWAALKIFFGFLAAALRNAPTTWLSRLMGSMSSALATTVQHTVFGRSGSAYEVVSGGDLAKWQDVGRGADELGAALDDEPSFRHRAEHDLTPLWVDYVNGALTLADGGRRSAGIEPIAVGSGIGVVHNAADVVPSSTDAFTDIPVSLAAVIGSSRIAGGDVLGAAAVKAKLERTFGDSASGVEARHAFAEVLKWQEATDKSYAGQVGSVLADFLGRARGEVTDLAGRIRDFGRRSPVDEQLRRRQQGIATITRATGWAVLATLAAFVVIAALNWVSWRFAATFGAIAVAVYLCAALALFILGQRHLFAEMNLRRSQAAELDAMQFNLRAALQDVSRLSSAYGQLLAWNRVLGEVLHAPFGPIAPVRPAERQILDGLPRCVRIGIAAPGGNDADATANSLQQQLYGVGWLTGPWERMLTAAARQLHEQPGALFRMPGVDTGSGLDEWSAAVASGEVRAEGGDSLWGRVQASFDDPADGVAESLADGVVLPATGDRLSLAEFSDGVLQPHSGAAAPFDAALFSDAASTAGRSAVVINDTAVDRSGLGYRAVVVQVGEGLPSYDFAMFTADDSPAAAGKRSSIADEGAPPGSGSMVF